MFENARLISFIGITDVPRARKFYRDVLGLELVAEDPLALIFRTSGATLRLTFTKQYRPAQSTVLGWHVADIYAVIAELAMRGVVFQLFPGLEQDKRGVWITPDKTRVAWFTDPDGNILSLAQLPE